MRRTGEPWCCRPKHSQSKALNTARLWFFDVLVRPIPRQGATPVAWKDLGSGTGEVGWKPCGCSSCDHATRLRSRCRRSLPFTKATKKLTNQRCLMELLPLLRGMYSSAEMGPANALHATGKHLQNASQPQTCQDNGKQRRYPQGGNTRTAEGAETRG